ncbi:DUF4416 family protein [Candidatus Bipolaricaulota bacterium]|nr:DUF4416 family protein [Candidatus Bipolaricaulota bacterium]
MGKPTEPKPKKLFISLLTGVPDILDEVESKLGEDFGKMDGESSLIPFDYTDYYEEEMGQEIKRKFVSFEDLVHPGDLSQIKLRTNEIESHFAGKFDPEIPRPINLDPGYLGSAKIVLATTKNYSHRIFLKEGIYAEVTLRYKDGLFEPLPWTYPDYRSDEYIEFFEMTRDIYLNQLD